MASPIFKLPTSSEATEMLENNEAMAQLGSVVKSETDKSWELIGYTVAEAQVQIRSAAPYTRGSGPPSAPIGIMPLHDKEGIIFDVTRMDGNIVYIVGFPDKPALRIAVRVQNIYDFVSPRTLEWFDMAQTVALKEKREAKAKDRATTTQQLNDESRVSDAPRGRGRPRKRPLVVEEESNDTKATIELPRKKQAVEGSDGRPGSSSSSAIQRGLTEVSSESAFDDDDTALAIARQLRGTPQVEVPTQSFSSRSVSPKPVRTSRNPIARVSASQTSSRQTRSVSASTTSTRPSIDLQVQHKSQSSGPRRDSVAAISSIEAANIYETLEKSKGKETRPSRKMSEIQTSSFYNTPEPTKIRKSSAKPARPKPVKPTKPAVEPEEEYNIDDILGHKFEYEKKKKRTTKFYYIKWSGDYENSWEPERNVGLAAIEQYKQKLLDEAKSQSSTTSSVTRTSEEDDMDVVVEKEGLGTGSKSIMGVQGNGTEKMGSAADSMSGPTKHKATNGKENGASLKVMDAESADEVDE
ncbi:uncharacterized protein LY89DRAFT_680801 [Mollisia scopiformis]|uniref:Chromo domain-containing protein n=1 Tax=Mollisia scopiformis TaxID=149040 RepID=A0A194XR71_MOLSC|nr:uncharacterized protein LY89DRAFT_680801 [Mollisia scopiformis]KUJ22688.1 hypothetical protein LY89DRAFT_680801 [Mollisia scopiformis]